MLLDDALIFFARWFAVTCRQPPPPLLIRHDAAPLMFMPPDAAYACLRYSFLIVIYASLRVIIQRQRATPVVDHLRQPRCQRAAARQRPLSSP